MSDPLVSIIIPCYNAAPWLAQTLASAFAQTCRDTEIIVVDDASSDASRDIVRGCADPRLRLLEQTQRQGAPAARNRGYEASRGELIQFLDADDLLAPDKIEQQLARWHQQGGHYLYSAQWGRFTQDPAQARFEDRGLWCDLDPISWQVQSWTAGGMMPPAAWLTPRRILDRVNPWKEHLLKNQDGEYFQRVLLASAGICHCPQARVYYRSGNRHSVSNDRSRGAEDLRYSTLELSTQRLLALEDSPRTRQACATVWQSFAMAVYPAFPDLSQRAEAAARSLGRVPFAPGKGPAFRSLAQLAGWRFARQVQARLHIRDS